MNPSKLWDRKVCSNAREISILGLAEEENGEDVWVLASSIDGTDILSNIGSALKISMPSCNGRVLGTDTELFWQSADGEVFEGTRAIRETLVFTDVLP